jgi:hypothetical protein
MKTNIIMKSNDDRSLFGTIIRQETKTGFLNLSDLQHCFNQVRIQKGWTNKQIPELISRKENVERIFYILKTQGVINIDLPMFMEVVENKGIARTLKSFGEYRTTGARETKTTFINPYIWVLIALELSPEFYAKAVFWVGDKLIINRIEAGNFYKFLTSAIRKFNPSGEQYILLAKALNYIVFDRHEAGIRNMASSSELKELEDLEKKMAFAIDMGYVNSFEMLLSELRKIYLQKRRENYKKELTN